MNYQINGEKILVSPPINHISVHKNAVAFGDKCGNQKLELSSSQQRKIFLDWLLGIA